MKNIFFFLTILFNACSLSYNLLHKDVKGSYNVMIYLAGDNDLYEYSNFTLSRIYQGIPYIKNSNLNVVAFCDGRDKSSEEDPGEAAYYILTNDGMAKTKHLGDINSGSLESLKDFIDYGISFSKEDTKNILIIWGHSSDLDIKNTSNKGLLKDSTSLSGITIEDFKNGMKYAKEQLGRKLDMIGLDACSLMYVEVAYMIKDYAHYVAGSQDKQNAFSWDYTKFIQYLNRDISIDVSTLSKHLVKIFKFFYEETIYEFKVNGLESRTNDTFSVVNIDEIETFKEKIMEILDILTIQVNYSSQYKDIFKDILTTSSVSLSTLSIDILTFINKVIDSINDNSMIDISGQNLLDKLNALQESFNSLVVAKYTRSNEKASGLSIRNILDVDYDEYIEYDFDSKKWETFIKLVDPLH